MPIEDDIARVHAVTDALVGPETVWVLHIDPANADEQIIVFRTRKAAVMYAVNDIKSVYHDHNPQWLRDIENNSYVCIMEDVYYTIEKKVVDG